MSIAAVIVAAGRGHRAAGVGGTPKQYVELDGKPVLARTLDAFGEHPRIGCLVVVTHPDDAAAWQMTLGQIGSATLAKLLPAVAGGQTRQASVRAGLGALALEPPDLVLIHDAARPFVSAELIDRVLDGLGRAEGALPALLVADTLKRSDGDLCVADTVPRANLWRAQTPQGFRYSAITEAHRRAAAGDGPEFTDDASVAEWAGLRVVIVPGSEVNRKLTTSEDLEMADQALRSPALPDVRTGTGFDVHRFAEGDHVWLGGVRIAHDQRLDGHSDADVALHALTDAILGAIGDGDIGQHFPPSDQKWKGAASRIFLEDAAQRVRNRQGRITSVDITILCEAPRIGPHREAMRRAIADILGITADRVGVKATTTEQLGFTGRREGIAAMACATVVMPGAI